MHEPVDPIRPTGVMPCRSRFVAHLRNHGLSVMALLALLAGCGESSPKAAPLLTVDVVMPREQDMPRYVGATGQVAAIQSVQLIARVPGYLQAISYRDGAFVHKGAPLFTIEQAPYLAQLHEAQASLASAQAKSDFAKLQANRYARLAQVDSATRQQAEQTVADRDAAAAALQQAKAALEQARITYGYTRITAPFDGLVSAHLASPGALVGAAGTTALATIVQLDPVWVNFNVPEQDAETIHSEIVASGAEALPVEIALQNEGGYPHDGQLDYVAPGIDSGTGTLQLRGLFRNGAHALLPGNFVRVRIRTGTQKQALLAPEVALGETQGHRTLMIVDDTGHVQQRSVTVGTTQGGWAVIDGGLKVDDRIIVTALQSVSAGEQVKPHLVTVAAAPAQTGAAR